MQRFNSEQRQWLWGFLAGWSSAMLGGIIVKVWL